MPLFFGPPGSLDGSLTPGTKGESCVFVQDRVCAILENQEVR